MVAVSVPFRERDLVPKKGPPRGPEAKVVYFRGQFLGPFLGREKSLSWAVP